MLPHLGSWDQDPREAHGPKCHARIRALVPKEACTAHRPRTPLTFPEQVVGPWLHLDRFHRCSRAGLFPKPCLFQSHRWIFLKSSRDADLAREVGVPPWKIRTLRDQAKGWSDDGLVAAIRAVAQADADVKGAASDASYTLERLVLTIAALRS